MVIWGLGLLIAFGIIELQAFPNTLTPGACTTKTLPTSDNNIIQEFVNSIDGHKNDDGWAYMYSSVKDAPEGLVSASLGITKTVDPKNKNEVSYTLKTTYQVKGYKLNPPIEDTVVIKENKLVSKSSAKDQSGKPEIEYVILKFKPQAYVYFYKCSNDADAKKGTDARFVLAWNGELSSENKKEIEDFDRSLTEGGKKVFTSKIQEI